MRKPLNQDWPITQTFGVNPNIYEQFGLKGHNGIDYGTPTGTEVVSPISGTVIEAVRSGDAGYGKYIKIENNDEGALLAHLQMVDVNEGDTVSEGQHLGLTGNTGFSTGPHLHFGYYTKPRNRGNGFDGYIDQLPILEALGNAGSYLGKSKEYWLQVEKDRSDLMKSNGELKNQIHEISGNLDGVEAERKSLEEFLKKAASLLQVPPEQSKVLGGISEELSHTESIVSLTNEITELKKRISEKDTLIINLNQNIDILKTQLELASLPKGGEYMKFLEFLKGKKTYITAIASIVFAGLGLYLGQIDVKTAVEICLAALSVMGLRNGISSEIQNAVLKLLAKKK